MIRYKKDILLTARKKLNDPLILNSVEKIFMAKRHFLFKMPSPNSSVVMLLSGGMDSICLWNLLFDKYKLNVYPIYLSESDLNHKYQERSINYFSDLFQRNYPDLFHKVFKTEQKYMFTFSKVKEKYRVVTDFPNIINNLAYHPKFKSNVPVITTLPARLGYFVLKAYEYAHLVHYEKNVHIDTIFVGVVPEDSNILRESTLTVLRCMNLSLCSVLGNFEWQVAAPIDKKNNFYYTKKDLIKTAQKANIPIFNTWSCSYQKNVHCGRCFNCITRQEAYRANGIRDKTIYFYLPPLSRILFKLYNRIKSVLYFFKIKAKNSLGQLKIKTPILELSDKITVNKKIVWYKTGGNSVIVLNPENGIIEELNESAGYIWEIITKRSVEFKEIIDKMAQKYQQNDDKIKQDLKILFRTFVTRNYIKIFRNNKEIIYLPGSHSL